MPAFRSKESLQIFVLAIAPNLSHVPRCFSDRNVQDDRELRSQHRLMVSCRRSERDDGGREEELRLVSQEVRVFVRSCSQRRSVAGVLQNFAAHRTRTWLPVV